jgi:hypothetical protein
MSYPSTVDTGQTAPKVLMRDYVGLAGNVPVASNDAYFVLMPPVNASCILSAIRVRFSTGGNGHYDVGIYTDNNGVPGTLLANAASSITALATSTNTLTPSLIGGNLSLSPGCYWLALWLDNSTDKPASAYLTAGIYPILYANIGSNVLPASAGSLSFTESNYMIYIAGIMQGGWS